MEKVSFVSNEDMVKRIDIVVRQTDYTPEIAREKLMACDYDEIKCIRAYLGIAEKKAPAVKKSLNQQIYSEIRSKFSTQDTTLSSSSH